MTEVQRRARTLILIKFSPRKRCENCRTNPAVVNVTRTHSTADFRFPYHYAEPVGNYIRTENLCQPCANEVVREESMFLDTIVDDGKPMFIQSQTCLAVDNNLITREDCGCPECQDELLEDASS